MCLRLSLSANEYLWSALGKSAVIVRGLELSATKLEERSDTLPSGHTCVVRISSSTLA